MERNERLISGCRVCDDSSITYLCDTYNEHSQTKLISIYECGTCGSVFVANDVDSDELGIAYSALDFSKYYEQTEKENLKKIATAIKDLETILPNKNVRIIDIGAGNGLFVEKIIESGFDNLYAHDIEGIDLSKISNIVNCIYQDFDHSTIPSNNFDVVTLLDVVEHVLNPKVLINSCARILKSDGVIYFHTPVVTKTDRFMHFLLKFPFLKRVGTIWQTGRTSIFHLQNYTPKSLSLILEDAGFRDIDIKVKNELSWPVTRYVKVFLLEKQGLPSFLAPLLAPFFYPLLATKMFNANKAIVTARRK
jgi:2-polyprenyl-3-methyl-5-hydroxy-6-metoxy-1,4-benzoquinol methylase